jgi:DNA polymerase III epsilon subunit-like protein
MIHLNGNLLCAVDVETTGLNFRLHDVIQISILPLDSQIKPPQTEFPFEVNMQPKRPENIEWKAATVTTIRMVDLIQSAIDPWTAVDLFEEWFYRLNLPVGKKIMPLAHNWPFDRMFIEEWLGGPKNYEAFFHHHYRDSMAAALYLNDRAEQHVDHIPVPKVNLEYCCTVFGIKNQKVTTLFRIA